MNYKLADFISNYLNEQKLLTEKYTRLFNQIKLGDSSFNKSSGPQLNLKKRSHNQDYLYNSNKEKTNCQYCGKQYTSKMPLRNHIKKYHIQENYTSKNELSTKQSTPYDDYDERKQDYSRREDSYNEADEELRQKLLKNVQAIEKRENGNQSMVEKQDQEFFINGLDSDQSSEVE
ncbi:unnamed protein product (macronuclear) [Paramecium tetraurelia]|uniref:C2H2-type domain-containing protein n=1 Tax=Paramecium tetraurelia TaxID=5888 RepID=A0CQ88_PARTE|nr:uncharacterized protein GSPATT00009303001 [Paramecium tetraurelia]CAK72955.1 unnamed protein product [Paramecium tetraurelia]|eukprot:XP_001440352.1 hypothetical protein (macronuclear) [Paramecium tetraurelia strain d4-2]